MRQSLLLLSLIISLTGCKALTKEVKKAVAMKKAAEEVCDCDRAGISTNYNNGFSSVTLTLEGAETEDPQGLADRVYNNLQKKYPKICEKDEVVINVENCNITRRFIYSGCGDDTNSSEVEVEFDEDDIKEEMEELEEEMKEAEEEFEAKMEALEEKLDELGEKN